MIKQQILKECCGIYGYKNKKTGKIHYIGQTTQPFIKRDQEHRRKKDNRLSDNKIQKYPTEYEMIPLVIFKLNSVTNEDLNPIETEFIKICNTFHDNNPDCWNLTMGGDSHTISEETRKKLSKSSTGRKHSLLTRVKMSIAKRNMSEETKLKMSIAKRNMSEETKLKISIASQNMSEETKLRMSIAKRGRNSPNDKYTLWDSGRCHYKKHNMYQNNNNGLKPLRCFVVRYNGYRVPCGYNLDFFSCELISDLISEIDTGG